MNMGTLDIGFKYRDREIIGTHCDGTPIEASTIKVIVLGQIFKEAFEMSGREFVANKDALDRGKAKLFGMKLQEIALQIQRQAEVGKPRKIVINKGTPHEQKLVMF